MSTTTAAEIVEQQHKQITEIAKEVGVGEEHLPRDESASTKAVVAALGGGDPDAAREKADENLSEGEQLAEHIKESSHMLEAILDELNGNDSRKSFRYGDDPTGSSSMDKMAEFLGGGA